MASDQTQTGDQDERRRAEYQNRRCFSQAQELFAAADFSAAADCLKRIPKSARSADIQRLWQLIQKRLEEITSLRRDIREARSRNAVDELRSHLQRLLELQPADDEARTLLFQLEETATQPTATTPPPRRRSAHDYGDKENILQVVPEPPDEERELWEFADRVTEMPPLPGRRKQVEVELNDDDLIAPDEPSSSVQVWVALGISGGVILLAAITTVLALLAERR